MSAEKTIVYDTAANFTFNASLIEFVSNSARLKSTTGAGTGFTQPFSSATGFTLDEGKSEITGGVLRQISQVVSGLTFFAPYTSSLNAAVSGGSPTGTSNGSPTISTSGGYAVMTAGSNRYLTYVGSGNINTVSPDQGCVRIRIRPAYSAPGLTEQVFFADSGFNVMGHINRVAITHKSDGQIHLYINESDADPIIDVDLGVWSATSGVTYEFELNWDITTGATRLFIDGVQHGATQTTTGTRSAPTTFYVGSFANGTGAPNFSVDSLAIFDSPQHTTDYTPGEVLPETTYVADVVTFPQFVSDTGKTITSFTGFSTTGVTGTLKYALNELYHDGFNWVESNLTYAQSNTEAEVLANILTLPASQTLDITLFTESSNTQGQLSELSVSYNELSYPVEAEIYETDTSDASQILTLTESVTTPSGTSVKYHLKSGSDRYWFSGGVWTLSDGSAAQSNTFASFSANLTTFSPSAEFVFQIVAVLTSDTVSTPILTQTVVTYEIVFPDPVPVSPDSCYVYVWLTDLLGDTPLSAIYDATFTARTLSDFIHTETGQLIPKTQKTVAFNDEGFAQLQLVETATDSVLTYFEVNYVTGGLARRVRFVPAEVPDTDVVDLLDLTTISGL